MLDDLTSTICYGLYCNWATKSYRRIDHIAQLGSNIPITAPQTDFYLNLVILRLTSGKVLKNSTALAVACE